MELNYQTTMSFITDESSLLKERAKQLAKKRSLVEDEGVSIEILEFLLSGEHYAIPMQYVKEVTLLRHLTTLPGTPEFILGIISIRGIIFSVTDLRVFFELPRKGLSDYNKIILLATKDMEFAILADQVIGASRKQVSQLSDVPDIVRGAGREFLSGVFPGPVILINAGLLLTDNRLIIQRTSDSV